MGDVGDPPDLARPAAGLGIGQDDDELIVVVRVGIGILLQAVVLDVEDDRRALIVPDRQVEGIFDVAHERHPVGGDLGALVLIVPPFDEIGGELLRQPGPGHAQVPGDEEHGGADVVLGLGDHLLLDRDLVAAGIDEQGPQDGHEHNGAADEELDHREARGPLCRRVSSRFHGSCSFIA